MRVARFRMLKTRFVVINAIVRAWCWDGPAIDQTDDQKWVDTDCFDAYFTILPFFWAKIQVG